MSNHQRFDTRWLIEQMALVISSPPPTRTIFDCAPGESFTQDYLREVSRRYQIDLEEHELPQGVSRAA